MFKIESYVTPILLSYVDKYVRDFKPVDAQVSLWGGGVALHNLVLKADVLQQEVALPFTLVSGRIHELLIQVPWTKIMSEPIIVTIDTIECVLSLNPPVAPDGSPPSAPPSRKSTVVEAPPGYMQALVRRIVSNISLRVHHLIVKYVQDDIVMSLNVKHLAVDSAGPNWEAAFADIEQSQPLIRRLVRLDDLTLCLDKSDGDGKIRFFQEPLLYRCQLDLRVLTRLISANTRRATSLDVQLRSGKLAFSVTNEQLALLLRLLKERPVTDMPPPMPKQNVAQAPLHATSANTAEPARSESWSEWAWSWLPTWVDREHDMEEASVPATPLPLSFNAYLDDVSLMFKIMETESHSRKRSRDVLELCASHAALKSSICSPTFLRVRFGAREVIVRSQGKCVCGYVNYMASNLKPTVYLQKASKPESSQEEEWTWPEEVLSDKVEQAREAVDEQPPVSPAATALTSIQSVVTQEGDTAQTLDTDFASSNIQMPDIPERDEVDELWTKMEPLVYVQYVHERSPPSLLSNPYENPPKDFEYSDWVEECSMSIVVAPVNVRVCMGLVHRLQALHSIYKEHWLQVPDLTRRVLTVEENESLSENLPQKRIKLEMREMRVRLIPWDHCTFERPSMPTLVLEVEMPYTKAVVIAPMYPHRVCSAASQIPSDTGTLWQGARRHLTLIANVVQIHLANFEGTQTRPCARADIRLVTHQLLHKEFFAKRQSVEFAYNLKISEMSVCGSAARLQAAIEVPKSLLHEERSFTLKQTTLPNDALHDEHAVAIDITLEDYSMRGYITNNIRTHVIALHAAKITALQETGEDETTQAWLFSAPDVPTSTPYLRLAFQWCNVAVADSLDYCGLWTEPLAMSVDPLLISWLAYKPLVKSEGSFITLKSVPSSQQILRRRTTPPSSSGRGGSRGSAAGAELVHVRARSHGSSSEPSEKKAQHKIPPKTQQPKPPELWLSGEAMTKLHDRLRSMLLNVELGLALVYVTMSTASAINCATLRDAMERHASDEHAVLVFCLGRLSMQSNSITRRLWLDIQHDGPTFIKEKPKEEGFPWKIRLADVSCYTLEARSPNSQTSTTTQKSTLKTSEAATVRTVLDLVTTTITVSVVTKTMKFMALSKELGRIHSGKLSAEEQKTKYFKGGLDFKPTCLKEFVRGPSNRLRTERKQKSTILEESPLDGTRNKPPEQLIVKDGPLISLGINLHADTPPIILRLEQDQVKIVAAAVHCLTHILTLLQRPAVHAPPTTFASAGVSNKSPLLRSSSELEEIRSASEDTSENQIELVAIFDRMSQYQRPLKTFFWFQWVVSRVTLVVASETVKLALDIDDVIGTVDFQAEYNQLKLKLASASIKHYERSESDWTAGVMGGRVLEAREPVDAKEDGHFLSITVTQAQVSHLPPTWKEDLNTKLHERNTGTDYMWEVYATLAPLEAIIQPNIIENVMSLVRELAPRAFCPLKDEIENSTFEFQWPLCYLNAGGIRVLVTGGDPQKNCKIDDTIIITVGKITVNPQPDNPICRRPVNAVSTDGVWLHNGGFDGRQYEIMFKSVSVQSSTFKDIALSEAVSAEKKGTASENPALKWSQRNQVPQMVPILHTMEMSWVFAPALYLSGLLTYGAAVELNLLSDCSLELSIDQLVLFKQLSTDFRTAISDPSSGELTYGGFVCPYATFFRSDFEKISSESSLFVNNIPEATHSSILHVGPMTSDSGVETVTSSTKTRLSEDATMKKSGSVVFAEVVDASQFLEVFVTMGVIDISLYVTDVVDVAQTTGAPKITLKSLREKRKKNKGESQSLTSVDTGRSLTYTERGTEAAHNILDKTLRVSKSTSQLMQITLYQPNVYYWKRKTQKTLQLFLFNARIALDMHDDDEHWREILLETAKGETDHVTGIPPALATFKMVLPSGNPNSTSALNTPRGNMSLDIERPVQVHLSTKKLLRLKAIYRILKRNLIHPASRSSELGTTLLYELKNKLIAEGMESITIQTSQMSVCGNEGILGWDSSSLQICTSARPEGVTARGLITALLVSAGPPGDWRHVVLQPLMMGMELEAFWEAWRRAEGGLSAREPTIQINVELDDVTIELRPSELATLNRLQTAYKELQRERAPPKKPVSEPTSSTGSTYERQRFNDSQPCLKIPKLQSTPRLSDNDDTDHFYKDDLRSGAFKILSGGQLPMAYQVVLSGNAVAWRYPHPRAITRVVAFPLPGQDKEIDCVLELYSSMLERWEPHTYFKLPVGEPREMQLFVPPPDTVFAIMWRFRACEVTERTPPPYKFDLNKFLPTSDPLVPDDPLEARNVPTPSGVTAEQLSGVLRVDSYFAPRLLPRTNAVARFANLNLHVHNSLPVLSSHSTYLAEGYYVSKPLMRTHRVLTVCARSTAAHALVGSHAGTLVVTDTKLSCDLIDCSTGTMEAIIEEFRLQGGISVKDSLLTSRTRVMTSGIHMALQVLRLKTLQALATDWSNAYDKYFNESSTSEDDITEETEASTKSKHEVMNMTTEALEGRVSLWIHNSCSCTMRVGQEDTDEAVPLCPGARLAYRWRSSTAPKKLRFALAGPAASWKWSSSLRFSAGNSRLKIESLDTENQSNKQFLIGTYLNVKVEESQASRCMHLSGRLVLANMLRATLLYKVRSHDLDSPQWYTVNSGEMPAEAISRSVVCGAECDMVLKIKFRSQNTCWSGDIPLKECPKENVPWLVKVPTDGESQFVSVWCRVVRGRVDGRILAAIWPLYVLHSHLPLDTEVLISTETLTSSEDLTASTPQVQSSTQTTPGRGSSTHLLAPGTTSARHSLSFQYKDVDCPVTREAVPMHYGVTDTSVFDKRSPVLNIDDVIKDIKKWLERTSRESVTKWPYSVVYKHWDGEWQPASLQPRCDVTVRYQAVRAGGGCSLELLLCPMVLLCNASPVSLTLRSYDAAPLCKLQSGTAISPPTAIIQKPFFISVEIGRETFVSSQLQVSTEDPGRYGTPPPGQVALDHAANFSILCNQKVALLTLYYEIKEHIHVLGVSSTYVLINRLNTDILASALAIPNDEMEERTTLRPQTFKTIAPTKDGSAAHGTPMYRFWLCQRWRGGDPAELRTYMCISLPDSTTPLHAAVPIRLGQPPLRRAVALINAEATSIPVVVTQMKHDNRWLVVVAPDPCPQFLVYNHTSLLLTIAQPKHAPDEPSSSRTEAIPECAGVKWWCKVPPNTAVHYSTPAYCARYPPEAMPPTSLASPILTISKGRDETEMEWCSPVVVADGEQLLQYFGGVTIKLRVHTHPHSTLLELQDVDHNDISASDIRRRLLGAFETNDSIRTQKMDASRSLERAGGITELLDESELNLLDPHRERNVGSRKLSADSERSKAPDAYSGISTVSDTKMLKSSLSAPFTSEAGFRGIDASTGSADFDVLDDFGVDSERFRCVIAALGLELSASCDVMPLLELHLDRTTLLVQTDNKKIKTTLSIVDAQIDNLQYDTGQYDFAVVASTRATALQPDQWPPLWNMFALTDTFATRSSTATLLLKLTHDKWEVVNNKYKELTELEIRVGTLALYIEDAYVKALIDMSRLLLPASSNQDNGLSEERTMQQPLRLRLLHVHPLDLTLTLHTAVRMYIALDQSPLRLSAFKLHDMMTSAERLTHALTVHYLSAAILGAGWVVGGLELLGAPGALAARVGGATGGVRGVASAAAAALLRSLSAWAGSLARNLDLLAGDEEHARRAAAARRRPPPSFVAGLIAGITNFAINILGAVGGLAHHPLVGVAVGETESGAAGLRRGLLGALTKPLSATADLVAYAGSGLLRQTGWDPVPEPRRTWSSIEARKSAGWHRDCVRWMFRLCELTALSGFEVLLDNAALQLLLTHKFLVVAEHETERIVEMIDFRFCYLEPYQGQIIVLVVTQKKQSKAPETKVDNDDDENQISAAAMARVARYTGAEGGPLEEARVLSLLPPPGRSYALHAALAAALHHNTDTHFPML